MRKFSILLKVIRREFFMFIFGFLPVKKNRILFMSYYGKQMGCNPYAIYTYLKENNPEYEFVWVYNNSLLGDSVKTTRHKSAKYFYYLRTSEFLIFNARPNMDIRKRKAQFYIQTWHSSLGFKMIEKDAEETLGKSYVKNAKKDSQNIDLLISGCKFRSECFRHNFWYDGEIAEIGTPRNDILFSSNMSEIVRDVKKKLNIEEQAKILLYAPTFRNNGDISYAKSLNVEILKKVLTEKFSGEWKIVFRLHPNVNMRADFDPQIINASTFNDMQMLLMASDIVVTDYSSLMFDFMLLKRPCFLYCPDIEEYTSRERKTYFSIDELPFDLSKTNAELINCISNLHFDSYIQKTNDFIENIGSFENGKSCENIAQIIKNHK